MSHEEKPTTPTTPAHPRGRPKVDAPLIPVKTFVSPALHDRLVAVADRAGTSVSGAVRSILTTRTRSAS